MKTTNHNVLRKTLMTNMKTTNHNVVRKTLMTNMKTINPYQIWKLLSEIIKRLLVQSQQRANNNDFQRLEKDWRNWEALEESRPYRQQNC